MQDIIWLIYIGLWLTAARFASRIPAPVPRVVQVGATAYVPDQRAMGCMMVLFVLMGAVIGGFEPIVIYDLVFKDVTQRRYPPETLDTLGRLAVIVGGLCGSYVGIKAVRMWIMLFLAWSAFQLLSFFFRYVVGGL